MTERVQKLVKQIQRGIWDTHDELRRVWYPQLTVDEREYLDNNAEVRELFAEFAANPAT